MNNIRHYFKNTWTCQITHVFNHDIILNALYTSNFDIINKYRNFHLDKLCDTKILENLCATDLKFLRHLTSYRNHSESEIFMSFLLNYALDNDILKFMEIYNNIYERSIYCVNDEIIEKIIIYHKTIKMTNFIDIITKYHNKNCQNNKSFNIFVKYYDSIDFEYGLELFKLMFKNISDNYLIDKKNIKYLYASDCFNELSINKQNKLLTLIDDTVVNDLLNLDQKYHDKILGKENIIKEILTYSDYLPNIPLKWLFVYVKFDISKHSNNYFELINNNRQFLNNNLRNYDIINNNYLNFKKFFNILDNFEYIDKMLIDKSICVIDITYSELPEREKIHIMTKLLNSNTLTKTTYLKILEYYSTSLNPQIINEALTRIIKNEFCSNAKINEMKEKLKCDKDIQINFKYEDRSKIIDIIIKKINEEKEIINNNCNNIIEKTINSIYKKSS